MPIKQPNPNDRDLLASGGGNATAGGVSFQASLGAIFATQLLTERAVDERLRLGNALIRSIRFETEAPLDDILIETDTTGWIFIQAKTSLSFSGSLDSEFGKIVEQIVRQFRACVIGNGQRGWDRALDRKRDRMLIAVGPDASGTITGDLASALDSLQAVSTAPLPQAQRLAIEKLTSVLTSAWKKTIGTLPTTEEVESILRLVTIQQFDVAGPDRAAAIETLTHIMDDSTDGPGAFAVIAKDCERLMEARHGTDAADLRRALARLGVKLRSAPSYQSDVANLRCVYRKPRPH